MTHRPTVGTLREKPLHAALKRWYAADGDLIEEPVDGFVVDIVRNGVLIEIQTSGFSSLKRKLTALLERHPVRLIYPIAVEKWLVKIDGDGTVISRRKSPKRGGPADLFGELVAFPELIAHPNLAIEVVLTREEEVRRFDGTRAWRRKGWVIEERRLIEVTDRLILDSPSALAALMPGDLRRTFTTADLAQSLRKHRRIAQQMAYCLRRAGVIEAVGKEGNAIVYSSVDPAPGAG